jgi:hypothetical protein
VGQQTATIVSTPEFGNDCLLRLDDLERSHVSYKGAF